MKVFVIHQTEKTLSGFHPAIIIFPTAAQAYEKVKEYLYEDLYDFDMIDEWEYKRNIDRLNLTYKAYCGNQGRNMFFCQTYCVTETEFEQE